MKKCSKCGACCRYLVFTITTDYKTARELLNENTVSFGVNREYSEDEIRYFTYRKVKITKKHNITYLTIENKNKDKNKLEIIKRGTYRLIYYIECTKLKGNLCSIWTTRPDVCDFTKVKLDIWKPSCCTD